VCIADDLGALVCGGTLVCTHTSAQSGPNQNIDLSNPVVRFGPEDATLLIHDSKILLNGDALFSVGGDTAGHYLVLRPKLWAPYLFYASPSQVSASGSRGTAKQQNCFRI
jgi:hypothetical protein